jgi:hypothetical protein
MMMPEELSMEKNPSAESAREYITFLLIPGRRHKIVSRKQCG